MFRAARWVIIALMSTVIIVLVLVVAVLAVAGIMLGRVSHEVKSARDTEYVELDGRWIRYTVIGGGPPVLLVHGWLASSRIWEQLARRLAQRFTVYSLDLTGFGESDKPTDGYGTRNGSRLLYAFCAHFGLTRATVVGHDFSGSMAVKLAADHPDIVGRLVLVATPADDEQIDLPTPLWLTTLPVVGPIFFSLGRALKPLRKLWVKPFVFDPDDLPEELIEDAGKPTPASAGKTYSITRHEISGGRVARQARIIKVPVLLVAGEDDQIIDPRAVGDWGRHAEQAEIFLMDRCGHLPMVESPAEFGARILAFLTGDSRYLEYVKEVSPPAVQKPVPDEGDLEDREERAEPEKREEEPPPQEPAAANDGKSVTALGTETGASLGDISWDFTPKKTLAPRNERTPTPRSRGADGPQEEDAEARRKPPRTTPIPPTSTAPPALRSPKRGTPEARNNEKKDAKEVSPELSDQEPGGSRRRSAKREPGSGRVPDFPGDLFQWSKAPEDYNPERPRRRGSGSRRKDEE